MIAYRNGAPVRLSDMAETIDDAENVQQAAWMNNTPAVIVNIQRQPGANVIEVVDHIKALLPQLRGSLPPSVQVSILTDRTTTIRASVRDVEFELMLAVALVVHGNLPLSPQPLRDSHPECCRAPFPHRHLRRHVSSGLQSQ